MMMNMGDLVTTLFVFVFCILLFCFCFFGFEGDYGVGRSSYHLVCLFVFCILLFCFCFLDFKVILGLVDLVTTLGVRSVNLPIMTRKIAWPDKNKQ